MDERGHYRASLPADRLPPFIVIHQEYAQVIPGLLLCAVIIFPWPLSPQGIIRSQAETVGSVQAPLIEDHLTGWFPDGDDYAFRLDAATGVMTALDVPSDEWVRDYLMITLNVPRLKPGAGEFLH